MTSSDAHPDVRHNNAFGLVRLLLATLVLLSHAPELLYGNRTHELLTRACGTLSFGELAVDGFFLVSGYLVLQSYQTSFSNSEYFIKRVLRIYPGYIVAFAISLLIAASTGGRFAGLREVGDDVIRALTLHTPRLDDSFNGVPLPTVNGSMWTVSYEFRCYIFLMCLGVVGVVKRRRLFLAITLVLFVGCLVFRNRQLPAIYESAFGHMGDTFRFSFLFLCGGCHFLWRDRIQYRPWLLIGAVSVLIPCMFSEYCAEPAIAVCGSYILFWAALHSKSRILNRVGERTDLSYGIYLYGWPIQNLLIWHWHHENPWIGFICTLAIATACAYVSWRLVEHPFLKLKRLFRRAGWRREVAHATG